MTIRTAIVLWLLFLAASSHTLGQAKTKAPQDKPKVAPRPTAAAPRPDAAPSHFEKAERLLKESKFVEAIAEYQSSLEDYPENEAAYFGMALAQTQVGLTKEAAASYEAALKINPQLWEAETNWGMLLMGLESFEQALTRFQRALELNPKSFQSAFLAAKALRSLGRWPEAADAGLKALALAENDGTKFEVHASLAEIYLKSGSVAEAETHLVAAKRHGADPAIDLELARLYLQRDEHTKSVELLQPLAAEHPEDALIQELLGRAWLKGGSYEAAVGALEQALKHQADARARQSVVLELVQALQKLNRTEKAIALLETLARQSTDANIHLQLGVLRLHRRTFDAAAQSLLRALELRPDCGECYSNLGSVFMLQEEYPKAIAAFSRFKTARPDVAGTYFYLGIAYDKLGDVENAFLHYQRFLALDQGKSDKQSFQARERMKVLEKRRKKR
jgi:tetratricopeptide (TPR) repeat protein